MKQLLLTIILITFITVPSIAQLKEAAQLATLTPTLFVVSNSDLIPGRKLHYSLSTVAHLSSYMVTGSQWKAITISVLLGLSKELVYDGLMNKGEPSLTDMKWNTLGVAQGVVFTFSLKL